MANNLFAEFDKAFDTKALAEDVKNSSDTPVYKDVPDGSYEVQIEKMELVATKETHKPMVSAWFKIVGDCEYKNQRIFMNQVIDEAFKIHIMKEFLKGLGTSQNIEFESYTQFGNLLMDIMEEIDGNYEYGLKYSHNRKGFAQFEIEEVYELE